MKQPSLVFLFTVILFTSVNSQSIQEARKFTENEQYEAASSAFKALIAKTPGDASIYYYYGKNLLLAGKPDSAAIIFENGRMVDPTNKFLQIGKAKLLLDDIDLIEAKSSSDKDGGNSELRNRYEQALANVNEAMKLIESATDKSKDINIYIEAADALINSKNKDTNKAKVYLDKANEIDPKNIEMLLLFGDLYTELNNGSLAAEYYNRALDIDTTLARALVSKGRLYKRSTNNEGAAREFENAIKIDPGYAPAYRELGDIYIKLGKLSQAKEMYKKFLELSKNNFSARITYSGFLYMSKNYKEALDEIKQVSERYDSNNVTLLRVKSYCYYELEDTANALQAIEHLFRVLPPDKRDSKDYEYYGRIMILNQKDSLGIENLMIAYSLKPSRTDLLSEIANAWLKLKQYDKAIEMYAQKIMLGKDVKTLDYYYLVSAYYYSKRFMEGDSVANKLIEISPTYPSSWLLRAKINSNIDSTSEEGRAKPYYEKFIELVTVDTVTAAKYRNGLFEAYGYLAYYYLLKKDNENSLAYLRKQLEVASDAQEKERIQMGIDQLLGKPVKGSSR